MPRHRGARGKSGARSLMARRIQGRSRHLGHKREEGRYLRNTATAWGVAEEEQFTLGFICGFLEKAALVAGMWARLANS